MINFNGFIYLLTLMLIALKLFGVINWSWWWVLAPFLTCIAISVIVLIAIFVLAVVSGARVNIKKRGE